jgi:SAM-dependent methyltransferase
VKYFDVLTTEELVARAKFLSVDPENVPRINFVDPYGNLEVIQEKFDIVISSHSIEHQPDLVVHLQKVERLLKPGGMYFVLVPDKRYIFDHFIPETSIADVLSKNLQGVTNHSLKSVIEHRAMTTHNDPARHWAGDHGMPYENFAQRARDAMAEFDKAQGQYIDVHASYFTSESFTIIMNCLRHMEMTGFSVLRNYHTRIGQNEFLVILQK